MVKTSKYLYLVNEKYVVAPDGNTTDLKSDETQSKDFPVIELNGIPVISFATDSDSYIADWKSDLDEQDFMGFVKGLNLPQDTPVFFQTQDMDDKDNTQLRKIYQQVGLLVLYVYTKPYSFTRYRHDNFNVIEFMSGAQNLENLLRFIDQTSNLPVTHMRSELQHIVGKYQN